IRQHPRCPSGANLRHCGREKNEGEHQPIELEWPAILAAVNPPSTSHRADETVEGPCIAAARGGENRQAHYDDGVAVVDLSNIVRESDEIEAEDKGRRGAHSRE